ncbi:exodeoxyribonuclease VII small subunit [Candidatus Margulisiibacteriota bacterium]
MLKEKIKQLEEILDRLESPNTDLDQSFALYEEGQRLTKELEQHFEQAKGKAEKLSHET